MSSGSPAGPHRRPDDLAGIAVHPAGDEAAWTSGGIFSIDGIRTAG